VVAVVETMEAEAKMPLGIVKDTGLYETSGRLIGG
jgi:hypothetical protein